MRTVIRMTDTCMMFSVRRVLIVNGELFHQLSEETDRLTERRSCLKGARMHVSRRISYVEKAEKLTISNQHARKPYAHVHRGRFLADAHGLDPC